MTIELHAAVDPGRARSNNEDSVATDDGVYLAVLADGMGGYNAGEVASNMATSFIRTELGRWLREASSQASDAEVRRAMDICVDNANRAIFNAANSNPQYAGMGTTLVVAVFRDNRVLLGHVGDSRCYRMREGRLQQITRLSRNTATTSVVPMPAYCGLELAAVKIARLALSTQMSMARRTSASLAWLLASRSQRPSSVRMKLVAMLLATSPAL